MKAVVANPPWPGEGYGARSDVRWPHRRKDKYLEYPIYLAYLTAILKKAGIDTEFLDGVIEEQTPEQFAAEVKARGAKLLVIECSTPSIKYDLESAKEVKEQSPDTFVALTGSHPTVFHEEILSENDYVDGVCRGEPDYTVRDIGLALSNGGQLEEVAGLTYRDASGVHVNEDRALIRDLDELPFPDREAVQIAPYRTAHYGCKNSTCMITSRGCPYRCIFCLWPDTLYGRKCRMRTAENVVDEVQELVEKYGVQEIYFDDDSLTVKRDRLFEICDLIKRRDLKLKWFGQARVDRVDEELLREMKSAGCYNLFFGIESGCQEILDKMQKGITLEDARKAFVACRKVGMRTQAFFLLGMPGDTLETMKQSVDFAIELKPNSAQFAIAIPHPGTKLYEICKEKGWLKVSNWEDFAACNSIVETDTFTAADVQQARLYGYKKFYFRLPFILSSAWRMRKPSEARRVIQGFFSILDRILFYKD